jgi:hypothetical protein
VPGRGPFPPYLEAMSSGAGGPALPASIGIGAFGGSQPEAVRLARAFLDRGGVDDFVFLALNGGRVKGEGVGIPRLNVAPKLVVAGSRWWVLNRAGDEAHAAGSLDEVVWAGPTGDGFVVMLSGDRRLRFFTGALTSKQAASVFLGAVAPARLEAAAFSVAAPGQRPLLFAGEHFGGHGTGLEPDVPVVVALTGRGVGVISPSGSFLRPVSAVRSVQVGDAGQYTTSSRGRLRTRKHVDSVLLIGFYEAEATFGLETRAPGRLEIELGGLLDAVRGGRRAQNGSAIGLTTLAERPGQPGPGGSRGGAGFCGHCGAPRGPGNQFCTSCGAEHRT